MRAGGVSRGFQLWVALPPELKLGRSESVYLSPETIPHDGPEHVLLGIATLRGSVRQQMDDVKTIYSQKQMSTNGEVLEVLKAEEAPIFPHSSDCALAW